MRMKVLSIVGARPQFIKAAVVSSAIRKKCTEVLVHTGQHYDYEMSEIFFDDLQLPAADYHLGVGSGSHAKQTGAMLIGLEDVIMLEKPDWVLVYGDTNSTLAGALTASKLQVPLAHVEAGLRSFNRKMPEEINRVIADRLSRLLFCPSYVAVRNLEAEGIADGVHMVGDVMYDAMRSYLPRTKDRPSPLDRVGAVPGQYSLATIHRAENTDSAERLAAILGCLGAAEMKVVFPAHPRTQEALASNDLVVPENVEMIDPVGYLDMLMLEKDAFAILTDSGGIQKEAFWLRVPCITLRDETEWVETVIAGTNTLVGADSNRIAAAVARPKANVPIRTCFGDGYASGKVVNVLAAPKSNRS